MLLSKKILAALAGCLLCLILQGCGMKGPLYLPDEGQQDVSSQPVADR